ncbi:MAG: phenylalanine--tRNA ligase subunit beta [bacterium]
MKVTLQWLQDHIEISDTADEIAALLTHQGLEVSSCTQVRAGFEGVRTCRILSAEIVPGLEKLWTCRLDTGRGEAVVLCGAPNVRVGAVAALAAPGSRLASGQRIQATRIRGVLSEGMLCSEAELGLSEDHSGILLLADDTPLGKDLADVLSLADHVLDVEVTPNRPDCLSVIGIAREIAAKKRLPLRYPDSSIREAGPPVGEVTSVEILSPERCPRYVARVLEGVRIGPSPFGLRRRLSLVGLRPINNIVDVTNFVMWELGQPLHAFDLDRLEDRRIVVRLPREGESLATLDGVERRLSGEDLLICDGRRPVALAGIMGGQESEIREDTARILLESAFFEPRGIRRTAKRQCLSTEASYRFEREIDRQGVLRAADRAAEMMRQLAGGSVLRGAVDVYPVPYRPKAIALSASKVNRLLGTSLEKGQILDFLQRLDLRLEDAGEDAFTVTAPSFRPDIREEMDVVEEVARLNGYDRIPTRMPVGPLSAAAADPERTAEEKIRDLLVGLGFQEVVQYSFVPRSWVEMMGNGAPDSGMAPVALQNPLSEAQAVLRTTLAGSLLDAVSRNIRKNNRNLKIFELNKIFLPAPDGGLPREQKRLAAILTGRRYPRQWNQPSEEVDAYDLKGVIEVILEAFGVRTFDWSPNEQIFSLHPGCSGDIVINVTKAGHAGRLHPLLQERLEIDQDVYLLEMEFGALVARQDERKVYTPIGRFPAVQRDVALILDKAIPFRRIVEEMWSRADRSVVRIDLFDLYRGPPVPDSQKSLAFRITYQDPSRTLTDEEVNTLHQRFLDALLPRLNAQLR